MPQQPAGSSVSVVMASDVGARVISTSMTRQNNTTAYAAGDVLAAMAGAPLAAVPLEFTVARADGGSGTIIRVVITSPTMDAGLDTINLYLYSVLPAVADDNAAFATPFTDFVGMVAVPRQLAITGGTFWMSAVGSQFVYTCAANTTKLWGVMVVGDAWTPTALQVFNIALHVDRN